MIEDLEIPEELKSTFKRVMRRVPHELKGDLEFLKNLLVYLKMGGEKLAKQRIEITKKPFREGYLLLNRLLPEEPIQETSNKASDENKDESPAETPEESTDKTLNKIDDDKS
jgi:hypothetical protein